MGYEMVLRVREAALPVDPLPADTVLAIVTEVTTQSLGAATTAAVQSWPI